MTITARAIGELGKLPVRTDVRTLRLRRYVDLATLPPAPATLDLTTHVADWPMYADAAAGYGRFGPGRWSARAFGSPPGLARLIRFEVPRG